MRVQQQPAFVLHAAEFSETSLRLEVFARDHGRLGLIAKGARRPASGLRAVLAPFQSLLIGWSGRGELPTLTGAEPEGAAAALAGRALLCGFYLNELLMRLLHRHDPHERLYGVYGSTLARLRDEADAPEASLRIFEKRLLEEVGYGLVLDREVAGNAPLQPGAVYCYVPDRGPLPAEASRPDGVPVHGSSLLALGREQLETGLDLAEAKRLLRAVLARHLGEKPLRTRDLFRQLSSGPVADGAAGP